MQGNVETGEQQFIKFIADNTKDILYCSECNFSTTEKRYLQKHKKIHFKSFYTCNFVNDDGKICNKSFTLLEYLKRHERTHTTPAHTCICGFSTTKKYYLKIHEKTHAKKTHICNVCNKSFTLNEYLKKHISSQHESPKYKPTQHICKECGHSVQYKSQLITHQRSHTGERPYACNFECDTGKICNKRFLISSHLKNHMLIHTGGEIYKCNVCGYGTVFKHNLTHHIMTHLEIKPFRCNFYNEDGKICKKSFITYYKLKIHMLKHKNIKPYNCTCGFATIYKGNLAIHLKSKNNASQHAALC